jgi:transcription elongation factor/antiterminator RfaH
MSSVFPSCVYGANPGSGFDPSVSIQPQWYAAYTAPRHEKAAADHLARKTVEVFLPVYDAVRNWNGRRAMVKLPLFPSYVFVRIRAYDRLQVLQAPQVVRMISFSGQLAALPEAEIEALRSAVLARNSQPHPYLATGSRVRIAAGPLCGLEGVVQREKGVARMVVSVDMIRQSMMVELDAADLAMLVEGPKRG